MPMTRHLILIFFLFFSSLHANDQTPPSRIIETHSLLDIHSHIEDNCLILFDLDNTTFTSDTDLGNANWYYSWVDIESFKGISEVEIRRHLYPIWLSLQQHAQHKLTEPCIPYLLHNLKQRDKVHLFAITAREATSSKMTQEVLDKLKVSFEKPSQSNLNFTFSTPYPTLHSEGIIFAGYNSKAPVIRELIQNLLLSQRPISKVIMVDDRRKNVEAAKKICEQLGISYVGLRYDRMDAQLKKFSLARAHKQLSILTHGLSNKDAEVLLNHPEGEKYLEKYLDPVRFPKRKDISINFQGRQPRIEGQAGEAESEHRIISTFQLEEILRYANQRSLVVFSINETLVTTETLLGSEKWANQLIKENVGADLSYEEASSNLLPTIHNLAIKLPLTPIRPDTPDVIRKLQKKGCSLLGISTQAVEVSYPLLKKLKLLGIDFSKSSASFHDFSLPSSSPAKFLSGVLFLGPQKNRGTSFLKFLDQAKLDFDRIIFVDDNISNIEEMRKAAAIIEKPFLGIHYQASYACQKSAHPDIAKLQLVFLETILPNHLVDLLL